MSPSGVPIQSSPDLSALVAMYDEMAQAVNSGSASRYAALYAPHAVIRIHGGEQISGRQAIERYEVDLLEHFPGTRLAFFKILQSEHLAIVQYGVNSPGHGSPATGHEGLLFYRIHPTGLIAEERRYLDVLTPMAQAGLLGSAPARSLPLLPASAEAVAARQSDAEKANVALVRRSVAALNAQDEREFLGTLASAAVLDELMLGEPFVGPDAGVRWLSSWQHPVQDAHWQVEPILGIGDYVVLEGTVRGTLNGTFGHVTAVNKPFLLHHAMLLDAKAGKIQRLQGFANGRELAVAVGQWPLPQFARHLDHRSPESRRGG